MNRKLLFSPFIPAIFNRIDFLRLEFKTECLQTFHHKLFNYFTIITLLILIYVFFYLFFLEVNFYLLIQLLLSHHKLLIYE